jgi:hypothetical protein
MPTNDEIILARLLGNIYNELFQHRKAGDNTVIKKASHNVHFQSVKEDTFNVLHDSTGIYLWGPSSGKSGQTNSAIMQGEWGDSIWG